MQPGTAVQMLPEPRPDGLHERGELFPPASPAYVSAGSNRVLSICFIIFLFAPLLGFIFGRGSAVSKAEKRVVVPAPVFGVDPLATLPGKIESWYTDRFGFRSTLIRLYSTVSCLLKASDSNVIIGKNRWIFYARQNIFEDFLGLRPFTDDELRRWRDYLVERNHWLAETKL